MVKNWKTYGSYVVRKPDFFYDNKDAVSNVSQVSGIVKSISPVSGEEYNEIFEGDISNIAVKIVLEQKYSTIALYFDINFNTIWEIAHLLHSVDIRSINRNAIVLMLKSTFDYQYAVWNIMEWKSHDEIQNMFGQSSMVAMVYSLNADYNGEDINSKYISSYLHAIIQPDKSNCIFQNGGEYFTDEWFNKVNEWASYSYHNYKLFFEHKANLFNI